MKKIIIVKPSKKPCDGSALYINREIYNDFPANGNLGELFAEDLKNLEEDLGISVADYIDDLYNCDKDSMKGKAFRVTVTLEEVPETELFDPIPAEG